MPSSSDVKTLGIADQVAQCVMAGTDLSKHQMQTLLTAKQEDGSTHTAQCCTCCGASITTVTDKHGLTLNPLVPFTWARAMHDTLDKWNRR
jgi:hypothetical protein